MGLPPARDARATYVELAGYDEARADHTVEVVRGLLTVDVDSAEKPIGVEILRAPAEIDDATLRPLARRFPTLNLAELGAAIAGRRLAAA